MKKILHDFTLKLLTIVKPKYNTVQWWSSVQALVSHLFQFIIIFLIYLL